MAFGEINGGMGPNNFSNRITTEKAKRGRERRYLLALPRALFPVWKLRLGPQHTPTTLLGVIPDKLL